VNKKEYEKYLKGKHWQDLRAKKLKESYFACDECDVANEELHIHHLTYERLGKELLSDLRVLCVSCHEKVHGIEQVKNPSHNGFTYACDTIPYHLALLGKRMMKKQKAK